MSHYEAVLNSIAFIPLLCIILLYLSAIKLTWPYRYTFVTLFGWGFLFADVLLIQYLAVTYAPSPTLREHAASEDGASTAFIYLFGWLIPLLITLVMDMFRWLWKVLAK